MDFEFFTADVFTDRIFNGAQIAVFPEAGGLDTERMQLIARELNLSETVFVLPPEEPRHSHRIRIFSPERELDFGGHPILASAFVLAVSGRVELRQPYTPLLLEQNIGPIQVNVSSRNGRPTLIQFTLAVEPSVDAFTPNEDELAEILGLTPQDIEMLRFKPLMVSCGYPYLVVPIRSYQAVRRARFDYAAWSRSSAPATAAQEILLFSGKTMAADCNFHGRLLGPNIGIKEDPPIGSAIPAFTGYLCAFEHIRKGTYTFAIDRGDAGSRRSLLQIEMDNKANSPITLRVGGEAVLVCHGTMTVPDANPFAF